MIGIEYFAASLPICFHWLPFARAGAIVCHPDIFP
jgi:hypothetical protein